MIECVVCGTHLAEGAKACPVCGTSAETSQITPVPARVGPLVGPRICPACGARFGAEYRDTFCNCGAELEADGEDLPLEEAEAGEDDLPLEVVRPRAGTPCLVVYDDQRQPVHYQPLDQDVVRVGRTDAVRGEFADLDLSRFFDEGTARRVSRKHAVVLRSRETGAYVLRPLAGNTGTQVEDEMAQELRDYPLRDGTRILLGGTVRLKFSMA